MSGGIFSFQSEDWREHLSQWDGKDPGICEVVQKAVRRQASVEWFQALVDKFGVDRIRTECRRDANILCEVFSSVRTKTTRLVLYDIFDEERFILPMFSKVNELSLFRNPWTEEIFSVLSRATGEQSAETLQILFLRCFPEFLMSCNVSGDLEDTLSAWDATFYPMRIQGSVFRSLFQESTEAFMMGCMVFTDDAACPLPPLRRSDPDYALRYGTAFYCGRWECLVDPAPDEPILLHLAQVMALRTYLPPPRSTVLSDSDDDMLAEELHLKEHMLPVIQNKAVRSFARWIAFNFMNSSKVPFLFLRIPIERCLHKKIPFALEKLKTKDLAEFLFHESAPGIRCDQAEDAAIRILATRDDVQRGLTYALQRRPVKYYRPFEEQFTNKLLRSAIPVEKNRLFRKWFLEYTVESVVPIYYLSSDFTVTDPVAWVCTKLLDLDVCLCESSKGIEHSLEFYCNEGYEPPKQVHPTKRRISVPFNVLFDHSFRTPQFRPPLEQFLKSSANPAHTVYALVEFEKELLRSIKHQMVCLALLGQTTCVLQAVLPSDVARHIVSFVPKEPDLLSFSEGDVDIFLKIKGVSDSSDCKTESSTDNSWHYTSDEGY